MFGLLTVAIAGGMVSHRHGMAYRATVGAGGAGVTLLALAWAIVSKGWLRSVAGTLLSRPAFLPKDESYAVSGRDKDGVVGGAQAKEHSTLAPGATVGSGHHVADAPAPSVSMPSGSMEEGSRVKTA
jgi:hypothetical protein